jgi:mono/diheme cytochrome c family protein
MLRGVQTLAPLLVAALALAIVPSTATAATATPVTAVEPSKADVEHGKALFEGSDRFENGAASCMSCHALGDNPTLGGARLGPPLDWVGVNWTPQVISAWLTSPPAPTMTPIYGKGSGGELSQQERDKLAAYIVSAASPKVAKTTKQVKGATVVETRVNAQLLGAGIAVAVVLLLLIGFTWRRRLRSVRRAMVKSARLPNT